MTTLGYSMRKPDWNLPCLVLGSAPNPQLPRRSLDGIHLLCVNSSGWSAKQRGLPIPRLTVLGGFKLTKPDREIDRQALRGLRTQQLLLLTHLLKLTLAEAKEKLAQLDYQYVNMKTMNYARRARMIEAVTGEKLGRGDNETSKISNGLFTACLALYEGAPEVILSGISLTSDELSYAQIKGRRRHILPDKEALIAMRDRQLPIKTSEPELAKITGIELV